MNFSISRLATVAALALAVTLHVPAQARDRLSEASLLSALPVAISVAAPVMLLSAGANLSVVAIETSADGLVWVVERASDGARASITLSGKVAEGSAVSVGTTVVVIAFGAGWVLSSAGQAIAYVPNEIGKSLLYNERVVR